MLLTEQEIDDISREMVKGCKSVNWLAQKIESAVLEKLKAQEPYEIEYPEYHQHGRGCGLEDRNITDRYKAMAYGWDCAINAMAECIPDRLYEHPLPPADVVRDLEDTEKLLVLVANQRDELLAAAEAIEIDAEECLDFDECTAMLVPIDTYHKLMEAIASVNEK